MQQHSQEPGLVELAHLPEYKVADGEIDPRNWPVTAADGRDIGVVKDLVVDYSELRARYVEVRLDGLLYGAGRTDVLIPMEYVVLEAERNAVRLLHISSVGAASLPHYAGEVIPADRDNAFDRAAAMVAETPLASADVQSPRR